MNDVLPPIRTLTLEHRFFSGDFWPSFAEIRPLVDGEDLLLAAYPEGYGDSVAQWRGPVGSWPLSVAENPRVVTLAAPDCVPECCGVLHVTMRRTGDRVIWDSWRNTSDLTAALPPDIHFDAAQYDAELVRAASDHDWEQPVDTIARLLRSALRENGWAERWEAELHDVYPRRFDPFFALCRAEGFREGVEVRLRTNQEPGGPPQDRTLVLDALPETPAAEQARGLASFLLANDPRAIEAERGPCRR